MAISPKRLAAITGATLAIATGVWLFRPAPVVVETATVQRSALTATVTAEGRIQVKDLFVVATPVDGELERIAVEPGDVLTVGQSLAQVWPATSRPLDPRSRAEAIASVAAARATIARAEATEREASAALAHVQSEAATAARLAASGAGTQNESEHASHEVQIRREALDAATAAVRAARAELDRAEAVVASSTTASPRPAAVVRAPVGGRVLRVLHESAGTVSAGTPLVEIADTSSIEIIGEFLTADAMLVQPGAKAIVFDWGRSTPIAARVRRIDPAAFTKVSALGLEEQRVRIVLDFAEPVPAGLGHDFHVMVAIGVWDGANVLAIPSTALFRSGDRWAVFLVRDGRARLQLVTPGRSDATRTVIDEGVSAGEEVVTQPSDALRDGSRVTSGRHAP